MAEYTYVDGDLVEMSPAEVSEFRAMQDAISAPSPLTIDDYRLAIQSQVDETAQQRNYDSGLTCASYIGSTNETWAAEASAFVTWRDAVWTYAYAELAKVEGGQRPQPTVETIVAELPAMSWPG